MGIVVYRKSDNKIMMEVIQYPLHDTEIFEKFIANGNHNVTDYAEVEIPQELISEALQKEIVIQNDRILFGSDRERLEDTQNNLPSMEKLMAKVETIETRLSTTSEVYDLLNKSTTPLEDLKKARISKLKEECSNSIYSGFLSLSTGHIFGFNDLDQINFTQRMLTIVAGATGPFQWKTKDAGVVQLAKEEFLIVIQEAENHKIKEQEKYWILEKKIINAVTNQEIDSIIWQ